MNIGIIGAGNIGGTLARLLVARGHDVAISNSRGPETLEDFAADLGDHARAATVEDAASFGDLVIEAIPFGHYDDLPAQALDGKIVVSASNYYPGRDGDMDLGGQTQTELVAEHFSGARVVKAFNTIYWEHLRDQGDPDLALDERRVIPLAGDHADAKGNVAALITELGFAPLDMGTLAGGGKKMQPGQPIYNNDLTLADARSLLGSAS